MTGFGDYSTWWDDNLFPVAFFAMCIAGIIGGLLS